MRPPSPLICKLANATKIEVDFISRAAGDASNPLWARCIMGRAKVFHAGRPRQTLRLFAELLSGNPLPDDMRFRDRSCLNPGCLNPEHYQLAPYVTWLEREGVVVRVSGSASWPVCVDAEEEGDVRDLCEMIEGCGGGACRTAEDLHSQWPAYDLGLIQRALDLVRAAAG